MENEPQYSCLPVIFFSKHLFVDGYEDEMD